MFKSIEYIRFDNKIKSTIYKFIDSDFECEAAVKNLSSKSTRAAIIVAEYKSRNYSHKEIVKNLFICNLFICNKYNYTFEKVLSYQNKYIDKDFNNINFSKLYYQDLKDMWDKHKVFQ